ILVFAGVLLRIWAGAHLGPHGNAARAQAPRLATGGPYRFSRNPLYLSNILVASGLILYANALPVVVSAPFILVIVLHHALLVRHEERVLGQTLGNAYEAWRAAVPRWVGISRVTTKQAGGADPLRTLVVRQGRNIAY